MSRDIGGKTHDAHRKPMMRVLNIILPTILLGCAMALIVFGVRSFSKVVSDEGIRLQTPGFTTVEIATPGDYDLWNQVRTVQDGTFRTFSDELPDGTKVVITNKRDGSKVPWRVNEGMRQTSGASRRISFGTVTFKEAGSYGVSVSMPGEGGSFSIEESKFPQPFFSAMLGLMGGIFLGIGAAFWLAVTVILILVRRATPKQTASAAPPQM